MARNHGAKRDDRLEKIGRLYLQGETQQAIAQELGVSQPTVSIDLKELRSRWRQSAIRDFDEAIAQELAKIDLVEREYWEQWERSKQVRLTRRNEKSGEAVKEITIEEAGLGNPRYLDGVMSCIDRRCRLLGLDSELKYQDLTTAITKLIQAGFIVQRPEIAGMPVVSIAAAN